MMSLSCFLFFLTWIDIDFLFCLSLNSVSTKEIILGTQDGQLFEMAVDEKDKREKYVKFLFELEELPEAFMALQVLTFLYRVEIICFLLWIYYFNHCLLLKQMCRWKRPTLAVG